MILDVNLPDISGLDLQRLVSVERTDTPIIFVTGFGDVAMTVKAMKAGAVEFLMKPFHADALLAAVKEALERSRTALEFDLEVRALQDRHGSLSRREQEVMALVVSGLLNKQVGFRARHQRDHSKGAQGPGHAQDEGAISPRSGKHGRKARRRALASGISSAKRPLSKLRMGI